MDDRLNTTYITFDGHVEIRKYRYVYFMIVFTLYILIICSNSTIVYLIWIHRNLHEPMYIIIAALLVNCLLFSAAVHPKLLIDFLSEKQIITYPACLCQFYMYYVFGTSEFLLLLVMSYDRYVSLCKPLQYPNIMTNRTLCVLLSLAWLLPACGLLAPAALSAQQNICNSSLNDIFCNNSVYKLACVTSTALNIYGVVMTVVLLVLPVVFILFTYARILMITYRSSKEVRRKAAQTCLPHLLVLINISLLATYNIVIVRLKSDFPKAARLAMTLQLIFYHPLFNPIIYGIKMREISKHLKKLFCEPKVI